MFIVSTCQRAPPTPFPFVDNAKVITKKFPTQRKTELGITLGKWERYWEYRPH